MTVQEEHERTKLRTTFLSQTRLTDRNGTVVEKAIRFYCGYLLNKEHTATEFIAP
jgi:hypothetical protein